MEILRPIQKWLRCHAHGRGATLVRPIKFTRGIHEFTPLETLKKRMKRENN
jgi:hypothetical protein